jgi:hypothetical protein
MTDERIITVRPAGDPEWRNRDDLLPLEHRQPPTQDQLDAEERSRLADAEIRHLRGD